MKASLKRKLRWSLLRRLLVLTALLLLSIHAVDPCTTTTISSQKLATPTPYQIVYTLPNPQPVLSFNLHQDSVGILNANPSFCGAKTYTTNKSWATVVAPANPLT